MRAFYATVRLVIIADSYNNACDAMTALLSEQGMHENPPALMNWEYADPINEPRAIYVPNDYVPDVDKFPI